MRREEAISVLKELLDNCLGLDGRSLEIVPPNVASRNQSYQIIIKGILDDQTKNCIIEIVSIHQLAYQTGSIWRTKRSLNKTEPDTFVIYQPDKTIKTGEKPEP